MMQLTISDDFCYEHGDLNQRKSIDDPWNFSTEESSLLPPPPTGAHPPLFLRYGGALL